MEINWYLGILKILAFKKIAICSSEYAMAMKFLGLNGDSLKYKSSQHVAAPTSLIEVTKLNS